MVIRGALRGLRRCSRRRYEMLGAAWPGMASRMARSTPTFAPAGDPPRGEVVAIAMLVADVLGAARHGIDCIFVTGGIHAGEAFPPVCSELRPW